MQTTQQNSVVKSPEWNEKYIKKITEEDLANIEEKAGKIRLARHFSDHWEYEDQMILFATCDEEQDKRKNYSFSLVNSSYLISIEYKFQIKLQLNDFYLCAQDEAPLVVKIKDGMFAIASHAYKKNTLTKDEKIFKGLFPNHKAHILEDNAEIRRFCWQREDKPENEYIEYIFRNGRLFIFGDYKAVVYHWWGIKNLAEFERITDNKYIASKVEAGNHNSHLTDGLRVFIKEHRAFANI